jgi:hypothetical protein
MPSHLTQRAAQPPHQRRSGSIRSVTNPLHRTEPIISRVEQSIRRGCALLQRILGNALAHLSVSLERLIRYASGFIRELADCASICARLGFEPRKFRLRKTGQSRFLVTFDAQSARANRCRRICGERAQCKVEHSTASNTLTARTEPYKAVTCWCGAADARSGVGPAVTANANDCFVGGSYREWLRVNRRTVCLIAAVIDLKSAPR